MSKRAEIDSLRSIVNRLIERIETLESQSHTLLAIAARQKQDGLKSFAEIQPDWNEQHPGPKIKCEDESKMLPRFSRFDKSSSPTNGPTPDVYTAPNNQRKYFEI